MRSPFPEPDPSSGQSTKTSGSWGYPGVTMLVTGIYKREVLVPKDTLGHMEVRGHNPPQPTSLRLI